MARSDPPWRDQAASARAYSSDPRDYERSDHERFDYERSDYERPDYERSDAPGDDRRRRAAANGQDAAGYPADSYGAAGYPAGGYGSGASAVEGSAADGYPVEPARAARNGSHRAGGDAGDAYPPSSVEPGYDGRGTRPGRAARRAAADAGVPVGRANRADDPTTLGPAVSSRRSRRDDRTAFGAGRGDDPTTLAPAGRARGGDETTFTPTVRARGSRGGDESAFTPPGGTRRSGGDESTYTPAGGTRRTRGDETTFTPAVRPRGSLDETTLAPAVRTRGSRVGRGNDTAGLGAVGRNGRSAAGPYSADPNDGDQAGDRGRRGYPDARRRSEPEPAQRRGAATCDDREAAEERTQVFGAGLIDPRDQALPAADSRRHAVPGRRAARRAAEERAAEEQAAHERAAEQEAANAADERAVEAAAGLAGEPDTGSEEPDTGSRRRFGSRRRAAAREARRRGAARETRAAVPEPRSAEPDDPAPAPRVPAQRAAEPATRRVSTPPRRDRTAADDATALYSAVEPIRDAVLSVTDLVKVHGQGARSVTALDGITLDVGRGRFTAIMGASGSGKSTLLHCLAGLDKPTSGTVLLGTTDLTRVSERKLTRLRRDRIGFVFQSYDLLPQLTVRQNILLPVEVAGAKVDQPWMDTVLEALELGDLLRQLPSQLSGGEQQRVAVARAVLPRPDVVLADEPTGALDAGTTREMVGFLRASVDHLGQTVVMVTHDPLAAQHTDRAVILHEGRLVGEVAQPTPHGVLDALAALAETPAGDRRGPATPRRAARRGESRWPWPRRRAARHT